MRRTFGAAAASGQSTLFISAIQTPVAHVNWPVPSIWTLWTASFNLRRYTATGAQDNSIEWDVNLEGGTYTIDVFHGADNDHGIAHFQVDGVQVGTVDMYSASTVPAAKAAIAGVAIAAGRHRLKVIMSTKNASSSAYTGNLSGIGFTRTGS